MGERVTIRCTDDDKQSWSHAAAADARKLADWARIHLNRAAEAVGAEATAAPEGDDAA
jgi:hypothetical protein